MMSRFIRSESGYALALTLVMLPAFVFFGLLIIDAGRGNNAHSDMYAAVDALALAGARELDGGTDAITRAQTAMEEITNSVSFLGVTSANANLDMNYVAGDTGDFTAIFLTEIPASDDLPLDLTKATTDGTLAKYVYVFTRQKTFLSLFGQEGEKLTDGHVAKNSDVTYVPEIKIGASAVATYRTAACDVTPLFICNPFESELGGDDLQESFNAGALHARLIKLHPNGSDTAKPGNFGFLQVTGANDNSTASANTIRNVFAGAYNPTCYENSTVTTKPGAAVSIAVGLNLRFDIYGAPFNNPNDKRAYPPAANVRKGYTVSQPKNAAQVCNGAMTEDSGFLASKSFPDNATMAVPGEGAAGAFVGDGDWPVADYWTLNHPGRPALTAEQRNQMSTGYGPDGTQKILAGDGMALPSRYDMYRYEIDQTVSLEANLIDDVSGVDTSGSSESGFPYCSQGITDPTPPSTDPDKDRRLMFAAIIDCLANPGSGAADFPVNSFASIFMVNPMQVGGGADGTIDVEIVDITGNGGNGTLDDFVRDEAILVR